MSKIYLKNVIFAFNHYDRETVWLFNESDNGKSHERYIAFAVDNFGHLICFDKTNNNVVFCNHENDDVEFISENFTEFLNALYE
ncbi:MAG: SMI1/KNR4 family protein [Ruminococcus sp.]|nr:SMI1/KNR4 family protein [Ruminococcus sp.]